MTKHISSTKKEQWTEEKLSLEKGTEIIVTDCELQAIRGFGGCFNELGKIAIDKLDENDRMKVYEEFFSPENCNFNFCRLPIGANDFSEEWYSHDEHDDDFEMKHFSIERDYKYLIPYIKEAQGLNSEMQFFASPWSPPTWLKFPKAYNYGTLIWEDKYLNAYALYFAKFLKAYEKENIKINQLHIQNEPCSTQKFPSCIWTGEQFRDFIENYLYKTLQENDVKTDIWLGTINGPETDGRQLYTRYNNYANIVMESEKCREVVKGISYQWAGKYAIQTTHNAFADLELIQSESECGDGKNSWEYMMYIFEMAHHYFQNGASAYVYWNLCLDEDNRSTWGWTQNSLVSVKNNKAVFNPEFYLMKHFSHFVKRGAKVLKTKGRWNANTVSFKNPNGDKVVVILNPFNEIKVITINNENFSLKPQSLNTVLFDK